MSNSKPKQRTTIRMPIHVRNTPQGNRVGVEGVHKAEPSDIDWTAVESELTEVVHLGTTRRVGELVVLGEHIEPSTIARVEIDRDELCKEAHIDAAVLRTVARK